MNVHACVYRVSLIKTANQPLPFFLSRWSMSGHAIDYQIIHVPVQVYTGTIPIDIKFLLYFQTSTCFLNLN